MTEAAPSARLRVLFVALTLAVTLVGYADRQVLALLKPALTTRFGWTADDYGHMTTAFQLAIAFSLLGAGWFLDRIGLRLGFAVGLAGWSVAVAAHAVARTVGQFIAARAVLGGFESVGTPASMKAVTALFPAGDRAPIIGLLNLAPSIATVLTPLAVTALYVAVGWEGTVLALGLVGLVCAVLWLALPFGRVGAAPAVAELGAPVWRERPAWALGVAKLLSDQAWWFFLFWLPDTLSRQFGLDMRHLGAPVAAIYLMAALGAVGGGFLPRVFAGLGRERARFRALLVASLAVSPVVFVPFVQGLWPVVLLLGLGLAAHQAFSTNVFALAADLYPSSRIGRVIGQAAFLGNIGGALSSLAAAFVLRETGSIAPMFFVCAAGYPLGWLVLTRFAKVPQGS